MTPDRCDAWHDQHDCREPGACTRALAEMCARIEARTRQERQERQTWTREAA